MMCQKHLEGLVVPEPSRPRMSLLLEEDEDEESEEKTEDDDDESS